MASIKNRLSHSWGLFKDKSRDNYRVPEGYSTSLNQNRIRFTRGSERTVVTSVYNRISVDCASIDIRHVKVDKEGRFTDIINSSLNECLSLQANIDQPSRVFLQDIIVSLMDEGCIAVVPVETDTTPTDTGAYSIETMRTGKITEWFPSAVRVRLYNDHTGFYEDVIVDKRQVAIIENPFYSVMNEPNSTMQRLINKLSILDTIDETTGSGSLDLLVQLPYAVKSETRKAQADKRRMELEEQLNGSKYGVAYVDAAEKVTQLNRPLENNLLKQIEYLTSLLYSQLGLTQEIMDGTADEDSMNNYYSRVVEPFLSAIVDEFNRKFLTKTARTQGQRVQYFRDPFKLIPVNKISEIADKFTRNEIMSSNEIRQIIGRRPSTDPSADELRNKNLSQSTESLSKPPVPVNNEDPKKDKIKDIEKGEKKDE